MKKAVFLDKDGTLIPDVPYNVDVQRVTLQPYSIEGLRALIAKGFELHLVSNQAGIAKGYITETQFIKTIDHIRVLLALENIPLSGFHFCPHHPDGQKKEYAVECDCRKPQPGMLIKAAEDHGIELKDSWMIGDILNDIEAGNRAGCRTILLNTGNETEWLDGEYRIPNQLCFTLNEAAEYICSNS